MLADAPNETTLGCSTEGCAQVDEQVIAVGVPSEQATPDFVLLIGATNVGGRA